MINWKGLPVEILSNIFRQAEQRDYPNLALVCEAWMHQAQACLYSDIRIDKFAQLQQFYDTIEYKAHLGEMVKVFKVNIFIESADTASKLEMFNIMTSLLTAHLPNLVQFEAAQLAYMPVLNALWGSQLKNLRVLGVPSLLKVETGYIVNYVTCAFLLKDRLENMLISDEFEYNSGQLEKKCFDRLFDKLDEFKNLKKINFRKDTTNEIQELEYVLDKCKSLKRIKYDFTPRGFEFNHQLPNTSIPIDRILSFIPTPNIKSIDANTVVTNDFKNLLYIMQKFPQLHSISLKISDSKLSAKLSQIMLSQVLNYLSRITVVDVLHLAADHEVMTQGIKSFWKATSRPGREEVESIYARHQGKKNILVSLKKMAITELESNTLYLILGLRNLCGNI